MNVPPMCSLTPRSFPALPKANLTRLSRTRSWDILPNEAGGSFEGWLEPGTHNVKSMKSASEILKGHGR